jgi:hypothetical protein
VCRVVSLLLLLLLEAALLPAAAQSRVHAVLLYDGKLPEQVKLDAEARAAVQPHGARVALRTMHAGRAATVPFLRRHGLTRKDAPLLLLMADGAPASRILRRVPLPPGDAAAGVRKLAASLRLPAPPEAVLSFTADGGAGEKRALVSAAGNQRQADGVRQFGPGGAAVYRLRLPSGLKLADLTGEVGGTFLVEWSNRATGPWTPLMDSFEYFGAAADAVPGRTRPIASLDAVLGRARGELYLRVRSTGRGRDQAELARLEVVPLGPAESTREDEWKAEAAELRARHLAAASEAVTHLEGTLRSDTTLEKKKSPYLLTGDLWVGPGVTLKVEPGVTVRVAGRHAVRVQGRLQAQGTMAEPIHFIPAAPAQPDDWKGIQFVPVPNRPAPPSLIEYCRIANAAVGLELNRFSGEVARSLLVSCFTGITLRNEGEGRIHHNSFSDCIRGMLVEQGAGTVTENDWSDCQIGLEVTELHPKAPFRFESNSIRSSRISGVTYLKRPGRQMPPLLLPGNHWSGTPEERLIGGAGNAAEVRLEPRLPVPPPGIGPGWGVRAD